MLQFGISQRMAYDPVSEAWQAQRRLAGTTANPNATPVGRGLRNRTMNPWGMETAAAPVSNTVKPAEPAIPTDAFTKRRLQATMPDAMQPGYHPSASVTPRLDRLPRTNPNAAQDSARSGAFGSGSQNRQRRWDLFNAMGKAGGNVDQFKGRAAAMGVTPDGWNAARRRLNMEPGPVQSISASQQSGMPSLPEVPKPPSAAELLKQNAPLPPVMPTPPLPNQASVKPIASTTSIPWSIAKPNPYSVRPTTGDMTPQQAIDSTRAAINIGKSAPAQTAGPSTPPTAAAPIPEIPPTLYPAPQPSLTQTQPEQPPEPKPKKKPTKGILESLMADASSVKNATANVAGNIAQALPWAIQSAMPGQTGEALRQNDVAGKFRKAGSWVARVAM